MKFLFRAVFVLLLGLTAGCSGLKTGSKPMTLKVHAAPSIFQHTDISKYHAGKGMTEIFKDVFTRDTGPDPGKRPTPWIKWAPYKWSPVKMGGTEYAYKGQTPADLVARDMRVSPDGKSIGRPGDEYNTALIYAFTLDMTNHTTKRYTSRFGSIKVTITDEILGYALGWTIAHEIGWHKIGGHTFETTSGPVHVGFNNWNYIFPAGYVHTGRFPKPAFLKEETRKWQLRLKYLVP